jgi:hypothetical protein
MAFKEMWSAHQPDERESAFSARAGMWSFVAVSVVGIVAAIAYALAGHSGVGLPLAILAVVGLGVYVGLSAWWLGADSDAPRGVAWGLGPLFVAAYLFVVPLAVMATGVGQWLLDSWIDPQGTHLWRGWALAFTVGVLCTLLLAPLSRLVSRSNRETLVVIVLALVLDVAFLVLMDWPHIHVLANLVAWPTLVGALAAFALLLLATVIQGMCGERERS